MTAANQRVTRTDQPGASGGARGGGASAAMRARVVLWAVVLANVAVVWWMFFTAEVTKNALTMTGKFLALHAALLMMLQLVLIARIPWLDRRIGMDRLTSCTGGRVSPSSGRSCCTPRSS